MVAEQLFGAFGEAAAKFILIGGIEADQHRLVVLFGLLVLLVAEAAIERIGALTGLAEERELRLAAGDSHETDEVYLVVFIHRPAKKLEFPVGPAADVEHPVGAAAAIDRRDAAVVGERRLISLAT